MVCTSVAAHMTKPEETRQSQMNLIIIILVSDCHHGPWSASLWFFITITITTTATTTTTTIILLVASIIVPPPFLDPFRRYRRRCHLRSARCLGVDGRTHSLWRHLEEAMLEVWMVDGHMVGLVGVVSVFLQIWFVEICWIQNTQNDPH